MRDWLTTKDLSEYLQIPESRIRSLVKQKRIPFHDNHGFLRFHRNEIDEWMTTAETDDIRQTTAKEIQDADDELLYREAPIKDYMLTASLVLTGETPWSRLPQFIKKTVEAVNGLSKDHLFRHEFSSFNKNFNDYLRVSYHLGLIEKRPGNGRKKHYYPTEFAKEIYFEEDSERIKGIILRSILNVVRENMETVPDERHSILLLWYILKIKEQDLEPEKSHFIKEQGEVNNDYPKIRLSFSNSLCNFLFNNDREREVQFLNELDNLIC